MKKSSSEENKIDRSNAGLWNRRYSDPEVVASESTALLAKSERGKYPKGIAYAKLNIAAAAFLQSKNDAALENLSGALIWFSKNPAEPGYAKALCLQGNLHESFADYEKALEFCLRSQKLSSEINDAETEAEAANQLGLIYTRLSDFQKALDYYRVGLKIREELNDENAMASSLNRIGMIMRLTKKHNESLEYYFRSLAIREKNKQQTSIPWTLLGIASTYEDMEKFDEALDYYEKGMVGGDIRCTVQCKMGSGRILSIEGEYDKAEMRLNESLKIALDMKALSLVSEAYSSIAKFYEMTGKTEKALESYKLFQKTRESVRSEEVQSRFRNIELAHAIEKSENEKEIYRLRHIELKKAYDIIDEKNKEITSGINSAKRIQRAILADPKKIKRLAVDCFIVNIPKDIVSGDFYWFETVKKKLIVAAADCTDHGVPGALMTMLGVSFLDKIVKQNEITDTSLILEQLRQEVKRAMHQTGKRDEEKNGMDIAVCAIDTTAGKIQYSGAFNNLWLVRNGGLIEYKADRMPIGINWEQEQPFSRHDIDIVEGDIIYLFSDGYADQFGGSDRKKFRQSALKSLITGISGNSMETQGKRLETEFYNWKGNEPQTDDVLVVGLRI